MTERPSYSAVWRKRYLAQRDSFVRLLDWDLYPDWEHNGSPEVQTTAELTQGLLVFWGGDEETASSFFRRSLECSERTEREKPYAESELLPYPRNRAAHLRARVHARNLLGTGTPELTRDELRRAALDYAEWCRGYGSWDAQAQAYYLNAVRLASLAPDEALVADLLRTRRGFKWHSAEHELLALSAANNREESTRKLFEALFDRLRDPDYRSPVFLEVELVCLELALLHDRIFHPAEPLDWPRAARRVGE